ncbi:MAG: phosphate ABC transporter permease PstA, partial [Sphingobacteriales bacterium]
LPAITGTLMVTIIAALFSIPFGICCAIYLNEYASVSRTTDWIRASIRNLAGIPSIIYGLFGLALFVQLMRFGTSALAAGLTLGLLSLPYIITTTEEALKRVPNALREATLALGATQYESIRDFIIPTAMPGIITGVILTISRVAGETAPILFTGAVFYITGVPTGINQEFMALPYHLYMLSTQHQDIEKVRPLAYGTVTILILLVISLNLIAFIIRNKYRQYGK